MRDMSRYICPLVIAGILLAFAPYVFADMVQMPTLPSVFSGALTIDGNPAPAGTEVIAKIGSEIRAGITTTEDGRYGSDRQLLVTGSSADAGKTIRFYLNDVEADQTAVWNTGAVYDLALAFSAQTPAPAITDSSTRTTSRTTGTASRVPYAPETDENILEFTDSAIFKIKSGKPADINVIQIEGKPSGVSAVDGVVYKYLQIDSTGETSATISFRVEKSWIKANMIKEDTLALYRYSGSWQELETVRTGEDSSHISYETQTPGFSIFAIAGKKDIISEPEVICKTERTKAYDPETLECVEYPSDCDVPSGWLVLSDREKCPVRTEIITEEISTESVSAAAPTGLLVGAMPGTALASLFILLIAGIYGFSRLRKLKS